MQIDCSKSNTTKKKSDRNRSNFNVIRFRSEQLLSLIYELHAVLLHNIQKAQAELAETHAGNIFTNEEKLIALSLIHI